jgi:hypothetical protein
MTMECGHVYTAHTHVGTSFVAFTGPFAPPRCINHELVYLVYFTICDLPCWNYVSPSTGYAQAHRL